MTRAELVALYGERYAADYDERYLLSPIHRPDTDHEVRLLGELLREHTSWLDVACGTGYFLSRFPAQERAGCDLSPAMLALARERNPTARLVEHSFLSPRPEWAGRWPLVSCMWYAYCYVDSMAEAWTALDRLAEWTARGGTCFLPLCDVNLIFATLLPHHELPTLDPGRLFLDGVVWSYRENSGEHHRHLVALHPEAIRARFARWFEQVTVVAYPPALPQWERGRSALVARGRTAAAVEVGCSSP